MGTWAGCLAGRGGLSARPHLPGLTASPVTGREARGPGPATAAAMASRGQAYLGPTYVAVGDFAARTDEELSFRAGALFRVAGRGKSGGPRGRTRRAGPWVGVTCPTTTWPRRRRCRLSPCALSKAPPLPAAPQMPGARWLLCHHGAGLGGGAALAQGRGLMAPRTCGLSRAGPHHPGPKGAEGAFAGGHPGTEVCGPSPESPHGAGTRKGLQWGLHRSPRWDGAFQTIETSRVT